MQDAGGAVRESRESVRKGRQEAKERVDGHPELLQRIVTARTETEADRVCPCPASRRLSRWTMRRVPGARCGLYKLYIIMFYAYLHELPTYRAEHHGDVTVVFQFQVLVSLLPLHPRARVMDIDCNTALLPSLSFRV